MILNDLLTRHAVFSKILIKSGEKELPKELKVKVMRIRMAYSKCKQNFDSELQEFLNELITPEFKDLSSKSERTPEEDLRWYELNNEINSECKVFVDQKGREEVSIIDSTFTENEFADIVEVNAGNDVEINGSVVAAMDFLEAVHELFVKE